MKPIKHLLRNAFLFRGECAYHITEAIQVLLQEQKSKLSAI